VTEKEICMLRTKLLAITLALVTATIIKSHAAAGIADLPNSCVLLAIKAQEEMGYGEILIVSGTIKGARHGHAVLVFEKWGWVNIYDGKGTRTLPGFPKTEELVKAVALDAFLEIPTDLTWRVMRPTK
jgi:hypothetical protein